MPFGLDEKRIAVRSFPEIPCLIRPFRCSFRLGCFILTAFPCIRNQLFSVFVHGAAAVRIRISLRRTFSSSRSSDRVVQQERPHFPCHFWRSRHLGVVVDVGVDDEATRSASSVGIKDHGHPCTKQHDTTTPASWPTTATPSGTKHAVCDHFSEMSLTPVPSFASRLDTAWSSVINVVPSEFLLTPYVLKPCLLQ